MEKGIIEQLTPAQLKIVKELRVYVENDLGYRHKEINTWFLTRFGRARNFNPKLLKTMLKNYVEYRHDCAKRGVMQQDFYKEQGPVYELMEAGLYHTDKFGQPVFFMQLGRTDWQAIVKTFGGDRVIDLLVQGFERILGIAMPVCAEAAGRRIDRMTVVVDFKGAKPLDFVSGKVGEMFKRLANVGQDFYPEMLGRLFILNAPLIFTAAWQVAKLWVHENTRERIFIEGGMAREKLFALIGEENLPAAYGGRRTESLRENPGPWDAALKRSYEEQTFYLPPESDLFWRFYLTEEEKTQIATERESRVRSEREEREEREARQVELSMRRSMLAIEDGFPLENVPQKAKAIKLSVRMSRN